MINSLSANRVGSDADVIVAKQNEMKWKQKCQELIGKLDNEVLFNIASYQQRVHISNNGSLLPLMNLLGS